MLFEKYTTNAYLTRILILSIDMVIAYFSLSFAYLLRHNFAAEYFTPQLSLTILFILLVRLISFQWFRTYAVIVRYAGGKDVQQLFIALSYGTIFLFLTSIVLRQFGISLSISILIIDYFLLLSFLAGSRMLMPVAFSVFFAEYQEKRNVVIFGAGQLGAITTRNLLQDNSSPSNIVAIFDDNPDIQFKSLNGIPIYHPSYLRKVVKAEKVEKAIIAIKNITLKRKNEFVDLCLENELKVLKAPSNAQWLDGTLKIDQIPTIKIEDLLNRLPITLDNNDVQNQLHQKTILVTGGAGSIGSELVRQITHFDPKLLIVIDQAESPLVNLSLEIKEVHQYANLIPIIADVTDTKKIDQIFAQYQPQIVFHAAAYKHVPILEAFPAEAIKVNVKGTKTITDLADKYKVAKFVMVSTDKAVNPTNVMGTSKRIAELYIQCLNQKSTTQYITTRFGNVLGSNGSVVPRFKEQIEKGGPITVTHPNITRYFMTIPEASQLVLEAGTMGNGGEIFLFDMGESVKIVDLASKLIRLSGYKVNEDIDIIFTGLRPGEKLREELLTHSENAIPTHHPKIMKAKMQTLDYQEIEQSITSLIQSIDQLVENRYLVMNMKKIVPEYRSSNSIYN